MSDESHPPGKVPTCPYCSRPMVGGHAELFGDGGSLEWDPRDPNDWPGDGSDLPVMLMATGFFGGCDPVPAHHCPRCRLMLIQYSGTEEPGK